jgi:hypothetical protein
MNVISGHLKTSIIIGQLADWPALPGYTFIPRSIVAVNISVVTEPLPSYQQFLIVCFHGYESRTHCLATARLEHTYFLRYFGRLGRMPHFFLLILFVIFIQSDKRGKWNYTIHRKIVMPKHTHTHTYIHIYIHTYIHFHKYRYGKMPTLTPGLQSHSGRRSPERRPRGSAGGETGKLVIDHIPGFLKVWISEKNW